MVTGSKGTSIQVTRSWSEVERLNKLQTSPLIHSGGKCHILHSVRFCLILYLSLILPINHIYRLFNRYRINDISIPEKAAMPKLSNVPTKTYSPFWVPLKRRIDLAAIINPTASYCPIIIKARARKRSTIPINFPALGKLNSSGFSEDSLGVSMETFLINLLIVV